MRTVFCRPVARSVFTLAILAAALSVAPLTASAQSFDEFDDEFDDRQRGDTTTTTTTDTTTETTATTPDEFGDEEPAATTTTTSTSTSTTAATTSSARAGDGHAYDARGDLLSSAGSRAWRRRRFTLHNSWSGPTGGIHVVDAGSGPSQSFRVGLLTNFFIQNNWLTQPTSTTPGDHNEHIGGALSLSWTPLDFLELFASISSSANSNNTESPGLFQVLGDSLVGVKAYYEIIPALTIGGDVSVALLNTVGDIGLVARSTSFGVRLNGALDLRALQGVEFPMIARINAQYWFDQSAMLTNDVENARYNALPTTGPDARMSPQNEDRQLLSRVERFALGINRTDFINLGIGLEFPIEVPISGLPDFYITPIVEWTVGIAVNSRSYNCLFIPSSPGSGTPRTGEDGCIAHQGFGSYPSTLTLGVRIQPPGDFRGLAITLAADIGTTGTSTFVRELSPNAPYNVIIGLGWAYDTRQEEPEVREVSVERVVEHQIPPPPRGRVIGTIVESGTTNGVADAVISFPGRELTAQAGDATGHFTTYEMDPGEVALSIHAPLYNDGQCSATIAPEGGDVNVTCELVALPRLGSVQGHVVGDTGGAVGGATVTITGPQGFTVVTSPSGDFTRQDLPPGSYTARVEAENFLITQATFEVVAREQARPEITLISRPRTSLVRVGAREITIRRQINFVTDSAEIVADSEGLLTEIADVLLRHPEITRVEIQGHTDNRGGHDHNQDLSQRRAESVRDWLVAHGVDSSRLEPHGYGDANPIAPNITASGRARNRRVQFIITAHADAP
jgi:outer membrane protein OmpA-like peptidoglycan-associated protein